VLLDVLKLAGLTGSDQSLPAWLKLWANPVRRKPHDCLNDSGDAQKFVNHCRARVDLLTNAAIANGEKVTRQPWDL
jgi:hypothetical protein